MHIGILQTGEAPEELRAEHGDYDSMCAALLPAGDFTTTTWKVLHGEMPASVEDADGWLITGSRFGAYEPHPWIPPLEDFIRRLDAARKPLVGICFGHQIIAQALGGKVEKSDQGWVVYRQHYEGDLKAPLTLMAWHQDQVVDLPPDARVFMHSDKCRYAGITYGSHILSVQPHPEFDAGFMAALLKTRGRTLPPEIRHAAQAQPDAPLSRAAMSAMFARHYRHAAGSDTQDEDTRG